MEYDGPVFITNALQSYNFFAISQKKQDTNEHFPTEDFR